MLVEIRASSIHGQGGFATVAIAPGTRVLEYQGRRISKAESVRQCELNNPFVFYLDAEFDLDGNVSWNPARFLNHSCDPNCEAELVDGGIWIVARRSIASGEEITFNYGYDLDFYRDYPCRCGARGCVGYMLAEEFHASLPRRAGKLDEF